MDAYDGSCVGGNGVILIKFHVEMDHTHGERAEMANATSEVAGVGR